jgi:tetratricopeptide (TPR) repeat protein
MVCRAVALVILAVSLGAVCIAQMSPMGQNGQYQGPSGPTNWNSSMRNSSSISGAVYTSDNHPLGNARVELRDGKTGMVVSSSYTGAGGQFEFSQIPQGSYQIVASSGSTQAEERVELTSISTSVSLRMPTGSPVANDGNGSKTVSVAQYRVPETAREELKKAREATLKNRTDEAQQHIAKALETAPNYADALTLRAILKLDAKDSDGAVADLQNAIQSDGSYAMAYMVLGSAFNNQLKWDDAIRSLQRGETLAPDAWQVYFEMGRAYAGKGDYESAVRVLDRAQKLAPQEYPLIRLIRAHSLMGLNRYSDAVGELEAYLAKAPAGPDAEQAQRMLEKAKESMSAAQK